MSDRRPGEKKGFVEEMRFVAMKLHTREQAPKEGKAEPAKEAKPMMQWQPTKEGYLRFLVESKAVYDAMEQIVASGASPMYGDFVDTGLERAEVLAADIEWFCETYQMTAPVADGPGAEYARFLKDLSTTAPPEFICHFYNVYFAHSAGGRMIGRKVSEMILDDKGARVLQVGETRRLGGADDADQGEAQRRGGEVEPGGEGPVPGGDRQVLRALRQAPQAHRVRADRRELERNSF